LAETGPELTEFTQSLAGADGGLGQFSGSLSGLAKGLFSGGGGDGLGGVASLFSGLAGGFAGGGLIRGDGTPTSDSNVALVSDGEYIINASAASKNKGLLEMINSGKAPKFAGASNTALLNSSAYAPTVNVHVEGGAQERQVAQRIAGNVGDAVTNATPDRFRFSGPQKMTRAATSLHKASSKNA
jgi:hypothetical protein